MKHRFVCPCCGFEGLNRPAYENLPAAPVGQDLEPPYSQYFGTPSYEVCSCCGFEFGNDDEPGTREPDTFQSYLAEWVANGAAWFSPEQRPAGFGLLMSK